MQRIRFIKDDTYDFIKSLDNKISAKIFRMLEVLDEVGIYLDPTKLKKVNFDTKFAIIVDMKTLTDLKKDLFKKPGFREAYEELGPEFQIIRALALARMKKGMTQRKLAAKIGITQSALARFESGRVDPGLEFLKKVTAGLGLKLIVK